MNNDYLIRIVLRARDEVSGVLRRVREEVDRFNRDLRQSSGGNDAFRDTIDALRNSVNSFNDRLDSLGEQLGVVRTRTRQARDEGDAYSEATDRASEATVRQTRAVKDNADEKAANVKKTKDQVEVNRELDKSLVDLTRRYSRYTQEVREGRHRQKDAIDQLGAFRAEMDALFRKSESGSELGDQFSRMSRGARDFQDTLKAQVEYQRDQTRQLLAEGQRVEDERVASAERRSEYERAEAEVSAMQRLNMEKWLRHEVEREDARHQSIITDSQRKAAREAANYQIAETARVEAARAAFRIDQQRRADSTGGNASTSTATADIDTSRADKNLDKLERRLVLYSRQLVVAHTEAETRKARTQLALLEAEMHDLGMHPAEVRVRVHESVNDARSQMRGFGRDIDDNSSIMQRWESKLQRNAIHVQGLSSALRGMMVLGVVTFAQQLLSVLTSLGASLVSVASSAIQAGFALGGAFAAGAAQAIPVVGLLVAAIARVKAVQDVMQQSDLVRQQQAAQGEQRDRKQAGAADALANAQDGLRGALEGVEAAQRRVADAHRAVTDAQKELVKAQGDELEAQRGLNEARREARRELEDLMLAARGATLGQEEAESALRQAIQRGDTVGVARAELEVDESRLRNSRAQEENNRGQREGIEGTDAMSSARDRIEQAADNTENARERLRDARRGVADAVRGVENAQRAVDRARRGLDQARRQAAGAADDQLASIGKLNYLLSQLTDSERRLYGAFRRIRQSYQENIRPITDLMVDSFARSIDKVRSLLEDAGFLGPLRELSKTIASEVDQSADTATNDKSRGQYATLMREAKINTEDFGEIARNAFRMFLDIAEAASPALRRIVGWIKEATDSWREFTSSERGQNQMRDFFLEGAEHLRDWARLTKAVIGLIFALMGASSESGEKMTENLTVKVQEATRWIETHQVEVKKFFEEARVATERIMGTLWEVSKAIIRIFDPESVAALTHFFETTLIPILENVIETLGNVTTIFMKIFGAPGVSAAVRFVAELFIIRRVIKLVETLAFSAGKGFGGLASDIKAIGPVSAGAAAGIKRALTGMGDAFKALRTGGVKAFIDSLKGIPKAASGAATAASGARRGAAGGTAGTAAGTGAAGAGAPLILDSRGDPIPDDDPRRVPEKAPTSRRTKLLRGAGVAGLVAGTVAMSTRPDSYGANLSDVPGKGTLAVDDLSDVIGNILNPSGLWNVLSRDTKGFKEWADKATESFRNMRKSGDVKGMEDLRDQAREYAKDFPKAAEALDVFAASLDDTVNKAKATEAALRPLGKEASDLFKGAGFKAKDLMDPMAFRQLQSSFNRLRRDGVESVTELRKRMQENVNLITKSFAQGTPSWRKEMETNFGAGILAIRDGMRSGAISTEKGMREIRRVTREQMRYARDNMDKLSFEGKERLSANFEAAAEAIRSKMRKAGKVTKEGMDEIRKLMQANLKLYGFTEEQARNETRMHGAGRYDGGRDEGTADIGRAGGGFLGMRGERGADGTAPNIGGVRVGLGEAVVFNADQQGLIDNALQAQYGFNLPQMFERYKSIHAGDDTQGGRARGGAINFNGHPSNVNAGVRRIIKTMEDKFPGLVVMSTTDHSTLTTSGNVSDHVKGAAVDLSGSVALMNRAARYVLQSGMVRRLKQAIYSGTPSLTWSGGQNVGAGYFGPAVMGQHANHLHLAIAGALRGALAGGDGPVDKIRRVLLKGLDRRSSLGRIAQGSLDDTRGAANRMLRRIARSAGLDDHSLDGFAGGGSNEQNMRLGQRMARAMGWIGEQWQALKKLWTGESRWDERADNPTSDAYGIPQALPGSKMASAGDDWRTNPATQIKWGLGYIKERYGSPGQALAQWMARSPHWYEEGGDVPGEGPVSAVLHGGEHVWTKEEVQKIGGHGVLKVLRKLVGGGAQATGAAFQVGGAVGHTARQVIGNITDVDAVRDLQPGGILAQIRELQRYMRRLKTSGENYAYALRELARLGESFTDAVTVAVARARSRIARSRFNLNDKTGIVRQTRDEDDQARIESRQDARERRRTSRRVASDRNQLANLRGRMSDYRNSGNLMSDREEDTLNDRLRELNRGDENKSEKAEIKKINDMLKKGKSANRVYSKMVARREELITSIQEGDDSVAQYLENEYNRQKEKVDRALGDVERDAGRREWFINIRQSVGDMLGRVDMVANLPQERIDSAKQQLEQLGPVLAEAQRINDGSRERQELVDSLQQKMGDLQASIVENMVKQVDDSIELVNRTATRRLGRLDMAGRFLDATGVVGETAGRAVRGINFTRQGIYEQRDQTLTQQRAGLESQLPRAIELFGENSDKVQDLRDSIVDLDISIAENTKANFQARVDEVNTRTDYANTMNDLRSRIVTLNGEISGQVDQAKLLTLATEKGNNLVQQGKDLTVLLNEARSRGDDAAVQDLEKQLAENEVATLENTKATKELTGELGSNTQTFTSSAWQQFRQAIFNGSGGLLPQYQIPPMDVGGEIIQDGLIYGHAGETIKPALVSRPFRGGDVREGDINIDVHAVEGKLDMTHLARRIMFEKSSAH